MAEESSGVGRFHDALALAIIQQFASGVLCLMVTAHAMVWVWACAVFTFYVCVVFIAIRRRRSPSRFDIILVKYGFVPLLFAVVLIAALSLSWLGKQ